MIRAVSIIVLLALFAIVLGKEVEAETSAKSYYYPKPKPKPPKIIKCPCKCFKDPKPKKYGYGYQPHKPKVNKAIKQCKKKKFLYKCEVQACKLGYYKVGKWCCDKKVVVTKPPTTTTKKLCPCVCKYRAAASAECYYKPYCAVKDCGYHKYKCCYH